MSPQSTYGSAPMAGSEASSSCQVVGNAWSGSGYFWSRDTRTLSQENLLHFLSDEVWLSAKRVARTSPNWGGWGRGWVRSVSVLVSRGF